MENKGLNLQCCVYPSVNGLSCMEISPLLQEAVLLYAQIHAPTMNWETNMVLVAVAMATVEGSLEAVSPWPRRTSLVRMSKFRRSMSLHDRAGQIHQKN